MNQSPSISGDGLPPWERRVLGKDTKEWVIRQDDCPAMSLHGLHDISNTRAGAMYRGVRRNWPFFMVVVSVAGSGRILCGAEEFRIAAGEALLIPPGHPHDLGAQEGRWIFSVLNYNPASWKGRLPAAPRCLPIHAQPLEAMIEAFYLEYHGDRDPVLLRQMTDIIHAKILRLANPDQTAGRLWPLWQQVLEKPGFSWNLASLARLVHLSEEHLRRVSRAELGRSPMEQVTKLRLQEAARRLLSENHLVEEIAHQVGFESERAFRAAFRRAFDCTPSAYRLQGREAHLRMDRQKQLLPEPPSHHVSGIDWTRQVQEWLPADLSTYANTTFSLGERPWFGSECRLLGLRPGVKKIHGVPFHILNENDGPAMLLMASRRCQTDASGKNLPDRVRLPVNRPIHGAVFLHACGWSAARSGAFASYNFASGNERHVVSLTALGTAHADEPDGRAANIQDWYFGYDTLDRGDVRAYLLPSSRDPAATPQYLYSLTWHNPDTKSSIDYLEILSRQDTDTTLAVLAIIFF